MIRPRRYDVIYSFGNYSLDVDQQELRREEDLVSVEPQVLDLLLFLIRNRERVVSKDDLITHVWNGRVVSDSTLTSRISAARRALGDDGQSQRFIRTIARKGVRFVADVSENHRSCHLRTAGTALNTDHNPVWASQQVDRPSIAVLPFKNMSGDPEQDYFSDGVTEDIITALSRLKWFYVIARNSTFALKGSNVDLREVGLDLGVQYLLKGSIRKSGNRMRVTAQLADAATGTYIWAEQYDRELVELFALQDEITARVIAAIEPKLLATEGRRSQTRSIDELDAWDLVARAVTQFWKLAPAESEAAIAILHRAVQRYPKYASAHSLLAFALLIAGHMGWRSSAEDRELADRLAHRAVELEDEDPWPFMALGYLAFTARRTDDSVGFYRSAAERNPNFAAAYGFAGWALSHDGRTDDAIEYLHTAIRMSPRDPFNVFYMVGFAAAHYMASRYDEAADWARRALDVRSSHLGARRKLCASLAQAGRIEEAQSEMKQLKELQPHLSIAWVKQYVPYTPRPMRHFLVGMRKAGLTN
jgi:TolB-like protein/Flp pilus assembly protein TadD